VQTVTLLANGEGSYNEAVAVLRRGGLVAFPTDTVYGLGAFAFDDAAVRRIYSAKRRPPEKSIPVLVAGTKQCDTVVADFPYAATILAAKFWPGPLTLVVAKGPDLPPAVAAGSTVGVRQPDHPVALELLRRAGPLAVTSANISGQTSPHTADEVLEQLRGRIDLIVDGGTTPGGTPSTIVDCSGKSPVVLRDGPISASEIAAAFD
jgi:L-threonylcarbamoyladenylate synthase